jgi:hypothetical protein
MSTTFWVKQEEVVISAHVILHPVTCPDAMVAQSDSLLLHPNSAYLFHSNLSVTPFFFSSFDVLTIWQLVFLLARSFLFRAETAVGTVPLP